MTGTLFFPLGHSCTLSTKTECTEGYYSTLGSSVCVECPDGTYNDATGQVSCTNCPAGYECPDKTIPPAICVAGEYR